MSESNSSYPYASARVKAIESKLITKEKLNRLIESKDYDAAMRQLAEFGYGQSAGAVGSGSFEVLIQKELEDPMAARIIDAFEHPITQISATVRDGAVQLYTL